MRIKKETFYFYLFTAPWIIGFLAFMAYPLLTSLYYSFTVYNAVTAPTFTGLSNYSAIVKDDLFYKAVKATGIFTFTSVPIGLVLSMFFAMLLNRNIPGKTLFRTFLYFPSMVSGVALSLLWIWIFNPQIGFLNYFLSFLGIKGQMWFQDPKLAIPSLVLMSFWGLGTSTVVFLASLQGVPTTMYEAAWIDGCGPIKKFFKITLPMISPVFVFQLVTGLITGFQAFTQAFIMTRGGPSYKTFFYVYYLYQKGLSDFELGYSSALAWVMMAAIIVITVSILKFSNRYIYTEERN